MNKKRKIFYFILLFIFAICFGYDTVSAACYKCKYSGNYTTDKSSCFYGVDKTVANSYCSSNAPSLQTYKINFVDTVGNGSSNLTQSVKAYQYTFVKDNPTASGYYFAGWSLDPNCSCNSSKTKQTKFTVGNGNIANNTTYYACWSSAKCWACQYNGVHGSHKLSTTKPTVSCYNSNWKSEDNLSGIGQWIEDSNYDHCEYCGGGTYIPDPETPSDESCYVCNNNSATKIVRRWKTNGDSDAYCSAGYTIDTSINKANCKTTTIPISYCPIDGPSTSNLECNNSKTLESTCNKRTIVIDDVGYADVRIEQKGYISSVLTPDKTYAGGGFSFGVMYTNTVKWNYVGEVATGTLHSAITGEMNNRLIDYSSYVSALNLKEIKFGNKSIDPSFLVKKCTSSDENIDYYNRELTVSCIFYIPDSILKYNGDISYTNGVGSTVSNKYYTPTNYNGEYKIEAKLDGMSRITDNAAKKDGVDGKSWIGDWSDTLKKCDIELYPLLYKDGKPSGNESNKYNFIYRPIDIYNPFPNRNAGINWFEWYSIEKNKDRLESTYSNAEEYTAILNNEIISEIKAYNKSHNYLNWDNIDSNSGRSSFIDGKYVIRGSED